MSKIYESYQDEQMEKFLTEEEEFTQGMIIQNMIQEDDKAIIYPIDISEEGKSAVMTDDGYIIMQ